VIDLLNMDNMELMAKYEDNHFDLAIVDPPYGLQGGLQDISSKYREKADRRVSNGKYDRLSGGGKLKNRILNKDKCVWDSFQPTPEYFDLLARVSSNRVIFGGNYFKLPPTRGIICWDKYQPWENFSQFELAWTSFDSPARIFRKDNKAKGKIHPTQKPVQLYEWILKNYAKEGDKILDTHLGSGSIAIACHNYGFDLVGCEIDKEYYDAMMNRYNNHIAQQSLFIDNQDNNET
jgi:site-specific DNA-methyltransferase (adenine-specific)